MKICGFMKTTLLDFPGRVACTVFTGGCNLRCPFCHNSELLGMDIPSEYTEEQIFDFLEKRKHTLEGVAVTGGEPTLQKDLPEFIETIRSRFGLAVKLDTNGTNNRMLKELIDAGLVDYVAMDVKSSVTNYAAVCGLTEDRINLPAIEKSRDILLRGRVPYEFRTTVVEGLHSEEDFKEIGPWIEGCERYFLQAYKDAGNVLERGAGFSEPKKEQLLRYAELVRPYVGNVSLRGVDY